MAVKNKSVLLSLPTAHCLLPTSIRKLCLESAEAERLVDVDFRFAARVLEPGGERCGFALGKKAFAYLRHCFF